MQLIIVILSIVVIINFFTITKLNRIAKRWEAEWWRLKDSQKDWTTK